MFSIDPKTFCFSIIFNVKLSLQVGKSNFVIKLKVYNLLQNILVEVYRILLLSFTWHIIGEFIYLALMPVPIN